MPLTSRIALLAAAVLAAGCIDPASPVSLNLALSADYVPNPDGSCTATVETIATGVGTASWTRVAVTRAGVTLDEYLGAETADFWGASSISAGEIRYSTPIALAAATDYSLVLRYGIAGTERDVSIRMECATPE